MTAATTETPIEKWYRLHPHVDLEGWVHMVCATNSTQDDWEYRNGPLNLPERYDGKDGWWL